MKKLILNLLLISLMVISVLSVISANDIPITIYMEGEIVSPEPGYIRGNVSIDWENVENTSLKYQEGLCNGSLNGIVLKEINSEVNGSYDWDTAAVDDGPYCIKLTWEINVLDNVSVIIDNTAPNLTSKSITGTLGGMFSPANLDGFYDNININMDSSELVDWKTLYIYNSSGNAVFRDQSLTDWVLSNSVIWDGQYNYGYGVGYVPDGVYTINLTSGSNEALIDFAGNINPLINIGSVTIDNTAPTTSDNAPIGWQNTNFDITLTPSDATSGIAFTYYCIDISNTCQPNIIYTIPVPTSIEGDKYFRYFSGDNTGNNQTIVGKSIQLDNTAPTVVLTDNHSDNIVRDADNILITANFTETLSGINETNVPTITIGGVLNNMIKVSNLIWAFLWDVPSGFNGDVDVSINATDNAGNPNEPATGETSYTIDNIIPYLENITITEAYSNGTDYFISPQNSDGDYDEISIDLKYSEKVSASIYVVDSMGNVVKNLYSNPSVTNPHAKIWDGTDDLDSIVPIGLYTINTTITDLAGNSNITSVASVYIDNSGPDFSSLSKTPSPSYNNDDVIINATITDILSNVSSAWISGNWTGTWINYSVTSLNDDYTYLILSGNFSNQQVVGYQWFAEDVLGNLASSSFLSFQVENRAPEFSGTIEDLSGMEDTFSATINLADYFYDLDVDDLTYTTVVVSIAGPTSPSGPWDGIEVYINSTGIATILSTDDWNGDGTIVFTAEDPFGGIVSSNTVYVAIEADENDPPILGALITSPINFSEDTSITFNLNCDAPESDQTCGNFRYDSEYVSYDDNLIVNVNSLTGQVDMSATQDWNGITYVKFLVDDTGTPMQTGEIVVKINVTPVNDNPILNIPDIEISEDGTFSSINLQVYTSDVDNALGDMSYTLVSESNDTLIDCELVGSLLNCDNPLADAYGISELIIEVEDGSGGVGNQQFIINVISVNDAPEILGTIGDFDTDEDVPFTIDLNNYESDVDDYDGDTELTWSVSDIDKALLSITIESANDLLIVTPLENQYGSDSITLNLSDSFNAYVTRDVMVTINPVNDAPVLYPIPDQNPLVGKSYSYEVNASDVDNVSLIFSADTDLFDITPTGLIVDFIPDSAGEHYVNISVTDGEFWVYEVVLFNITFENEIPVAYDVSIITDEDTSVLITLNCTDADVNDILNYIIVTEPTNGTLSGSGNTRTYSPDTNYYGTDSFTYKCSDGLNESNTATVDITITSVNDALRIVSYSPTYNPIIRDETQEFSVVVEDIDSQIIYEWEVDENSVGTNSNTYTYTYTPVNDGEFNISVEANDGLNTVSHEWTLTVSSVPVANTFTGSATTNFSAILDLSSASGVVLENDYGKIEFLDTLDLSDVFDLDNTVNIEESVFAMDTSIYPQLNKPARITLTGLSYTSVPEVFYSNQFTTNPNYINDKCDFCEVISYTGFPTTDGIVIFEVEHFSSFAVIGSGIKYNISEFDDLETCVEGEQGDLIVEIEEPSNRDDFGPGDEIEIEVKVKNNADEDKKIVVEAYLYNVDEDEEVEDAESEYEEIRDGRSEDFEMTMIVPDDFEEDDNYILFVKAYEKSDEEVQCNYDAIEVELERERHKLIISEVTVDSSKGYPGGSLELFVEVNNVGGEDEEDVYITIEQSDLGISEKSELLEIEQYGDDDSITESFKINIPKNASIKDYDFEIKVVYDDGEDLKLVTVSLIVQTVFEPVERLDVIELTSPETVIKLDATPVSKISVDSKAIFKPKNPVLTLLVILIIGIIIELLAIAILRRLRKSG